MNKRLILVIKILVGYVTYDRYISGILEISERGFKRNIRLNIIKTQNTKINRSVAPFKCCASHKYLKNSILSTVYETLCTSESLQIYDFISFGVLTIKGEIKITKEF